MWQANAATDDMRCHIGSGPPRPSLQPANTAQIGTGTGRAMQSPVRVRGTWLVALCISVACGNSPREEIDPEFVVAAYEQTESLAALSRPAVGEFAERSQVTAPSESEPTLRVVAAEHRSTDVVPADVALRSIAWVHPLAEHRYLPRHESQEFAAARSGSRPAECGAGHCGVDIGDLRGSVVHAAADGKVVRVHHEQAGRAGRYVVLSHYGGIETVYVHLDEIHSAMEVGSPVYAGQPVGTLGRTGIKNSAPHLHFAIAHSGQSGRLYLDPVPILRQATVLASPAPLDVVQTAWPHELAGTLVRDIPSVYEAATEPAPKPTAPPNAHGATIAGQVRDHNGERVAAAKVSVGGREATTDTLGRFRLVGVETGQVTVTAEADTGWGELRLGLSPGDEYVTLQINIR